MKRPSAVLIIGILVMVLTAVIFFTIVGFGALSAIHFITLTAMLISEAITTGYAYLAKSSARRYAAAFVTAAMIPFSVYLSIVYITRFPLNYSTYVGLFVAGQLIVNIIGFILVRFDTNKTEENQSFQEAKTNMLNLRKLVKVIMADPAAQPIADELRALEDKLHFSNDNVIAAEDDQIRAMLAELHSNVDNPEFDCKQHIAKINKVIDMRNIMTSRTV